MDSLQMTLDQVLHEGHTEKIMFVLQGTPEGERFIETANDAEFSRALCALDPKHFVEPYITLYRNLDPHLHFNMRFRSCRSLEDRWDQYSILLDAVIAKRVAAGHHLTRDTLRHILLWAGSMGDYQLARDVFGDLIPQREMEPDLECFNSYLKACVWASWHETRFRNRSRVIKAFAGVRRDSYHWRTPRKAPQGEEFDPPQRPPLSPPETRQTALDIFQQLTNQGFTGNEDTYTSLMLAMSQAGDLEAVKSILKSVWNVNVDLLLQYDEEEIESPTYYEDHSPLRPTELLLSSIVYIFGNHNNMSLAYLLLDYVSRNYNLSVPEPVWSRLYETTFVLSCKHGWGPANLKRATKTEMNLGQLDKGTLKRFFDLITDEPHNIEPSVVMLIMLARLECDYRMLDSCLDYIRRAMPILEEEKTRLSVLYDELVRVALAIGRGQEPLSTHFLDLRRQFILDSMHVDKSLQYILRMISHLLQENEWAGGGHRVEFSQRRLPNLVKEFETFLPNELSYDTPTGHVRFTNAAVHRKYAVQCADDHFHARVGNVRFLLDTDDYKMLLSNLQKLPGTLHWRERWCFWCQEPGHHNRDCTKGHRILAGLDQPVVRGLKDDSADEFE